MGTIAGSIDIKVKTEELVNQAEAVRKLAEDMKKRFQHMEELMSRTNSYWIGEAGEKHRKMYMDKRENTDIMIRRLMEHPRDLLMISGNYVQVEKDIISDTQTLPSDVIS